MDSALDKVRLGMKKMGIPDKEDILRGRTVKELISFRTASLLCIALCLMCVVANPDCYMGIADYYIFFLVFFAMCVGARIKFTWDTPTKLIVALLVYVVVGTLIAAVNGAFSSGYSATYALYLLFALFAVNMKYDKHEMNFLLVAYVLSAVILSLFILIFQYDYYGSGNERHTIKFFFNDPFDPNFLAAFLVFPGAIAFAKVLNRFTVARLVLFLLILAGLLFTSSRGAMLTLFLAIGAILLVFCKETKQVKVLLVFAGVAVVALFAIWLIAPNSLIRLFNFQSYADGSNAKRALDWYYGWQAFLQSPIIGYGIRGELGIVQGTLGVSYISHNTYIALLMQLGLIGVILPVVGIIGTAWAARKNLALLASLIASVLVCIFVSAEASLFFWMPIFVTLLVMRCDRDGKEPFSWSM